MFWTILLWIASFILNLVLSPKPQNARPSSLEDFDFPVAEEGLEIPVLFGTVQLKGPNCVWYGDLTLQAIKGPRRYVFFGPRQITGYRYAIGMHLVLCHSVVDEIREIWIGEKQVFGLTGVPHMGDGTVFIDEMQLFGGDQSGGGVRGYVNFCMGAPTQLQNSYLMTALGESILPAFRGISCAVLERVYIGNSTYIAPWEFMAKRIHLTTQNVEQWYDAKAAVPDSAPSTSTETGLDLDAGFNLSFRGFDTNGNYAAVGTNSSANQGKILVWNLTTGALIYTFTYDLPSAIGVATFITSDDELLYREGGNIWGSGETQLVFRQLSDGAITQTIPLTPYITGSEFNAGFDCAEIEIVSEKYIIGIVEPYLAFRGPYLVLKKTAGTWGVFGYGDGDGTTISGYDQLSVGTQYMYLASSAGNVGLVDWTGGFTESLVTPPGSGGSGIHSLTYIQSLDQVYILFASGLMGLYSPDLSTLLTSDTPVVSVHLNEVRVIGERALSDPTTVVVTEQDNLSRILRVYFINLPALTISETVQVYGTPLVNQTNMLYAAYNQDKGGLFVSPQGSPRHLAFWPMTGPDALDMNPSHIIRECLTNPVWGMGYNDSDIDDDSFTYAADYLYDEYFGLSMLWTREETIEEFVTVILSHIDAYLYVRRDTGKFFLKLVRDDYLVDDLPVIDEDDVISWDEVTHRQPGEASNSVTVKYVDRRNRGGDASHTVDNIAGIQQYGEKINTTRFYPGISHGGLAVRVATRDLTSLSAGIVSGTIVCKRTVGELYPGDPFRLTSSRHVLDGMVMRVAALEFGDGRDNGIRIDYVQDVFHLNIGELVDSSEGDWESPGDPPSAVVPRLVWEMPYREAVQNVGEADLTAVLAADQDMGMMEAAGGRPTSDSVNALLFVNGEDTTEVLDFAPAGYIDADLGALDTSVTLASYVDLDNITAGALGVLVEDTAATLEIVRVTAASGPDLTLDRGMLDTVPRAHLSGTAFILFEDFAASEYEAWTAGDTISVKLLTRTPLGVLSTSLAPADSLTFDSRAFRPLRPANVTVEGFDIGPVDATALSSVDVDWSNRNRLTEVGTLRTWSGADVPPEAGQTTVIEVLDSDNSTILATYSGLTGTTYSVNTSVFISPSGYIRVGAERDGYREWQAYTIELLVDAELMFIDLDQLFIDTDEMTLTES